MFVLPTRWQRSWRRGHASLNVVVSGSAFDPRRPTTSASMSVTIRRLHLAWQIRKGHVGVEASLWPATVRVVDKLRDTSVNVNADGSVVVSGVVEESHLVSWSEL